MTTTKQTKKYYVGSRTIHANNSSWLKSTLQTAIAAATDIAKETGETQYVVQVVRIIHVNKPTITVEKV